MHVDWLKVAAKCFAVLTLGFGVGGLVGGIAFVAIGDEGFLRDSPLGHVAEVIGPGAGCVAASIATFINVSLGGKRDAGKPGMPGPTGLE